MLMHWRFAKVEMETSVVINRPGEGGNYLEVAYKGQLAQTSYTHYY